MLATSLDIGLPPQWNVAVMEVRAKQAQELSRVRFPSVRHWLYTAGNALTTANLTQSNSIKALGWTAAETLETYMRLRSFDEDWNAPGMEVYDDL